MLDVGFSEILLTSAIALIVLGPEKLPKVARQVGNWVGRARLMARQLTEQLEREVSADELMKQTKPNPPASLPGNGPKPYASADIEPYYTPRDSAPNEPAAAETTSGLPATEVHGADWHASPPEKKPANE